MSQRPLQAHSVAEIHLYLAATPCSDCSGPLNGTPVVETGKATVSAMCGVCKRTHDLAFTLRSSVELEERDGYLPTINQTSEPSQIIDVGQWITLYGVLMQAVGRETDKIEFRRLEFQAAMCLEEALKFYADNELPQEGAIFTEATRTRFHDHPEMFARQHLVDLRAKLPKSNPGRNNSGLNIPTRPWWRFWS